MKNIKFGQKRVSLWVPIIVLTVLISLIVVYVQSQNNIGVYKGDDEPSQVAPTEEKIDLTMRTNSEYNYSIGIPDDWNAVTQRGHETYIHSPSATSVQIRISDFNPYILDVTQDSLSLELSSAGYTLSSFAWNDNSSYMTTYAKTNDSGSSGAVYAEVTYFDRATIIRVVYTISNRYYSKMQSTITAIIDSFKWNRANPFPDGTVMYYVEDGAYEFAYPSTWTTGISGTAYLAQDSETGATMSVQATASTATYGGFSKLDYTNFAAQSRSNFVLQSYNADANTIYAQATYTYNNTNMVLTQYLIASGTYEYAITFETTQAAYSSQAEMFNNIIKVFRIWNTSSQTKGD